MIENHHENLISTLPLVHYIRVMDSHKIVNFGHTTREFMGINSERATLIKEIKQIEDISLLKALKAVLDYGLKNEGRITIEQYNKALEEAEAEIGQGEFIGHKALKEQMKSW